MLNPCLLSIIICINLYKLIFNVKIMQLAFEPVSAEYTKAEEAYDSGVSAIKFLNSEISKSLKYYYRRKARAQFTLCLATLRNLRSGYGIESIANLPMPHELCWFNIKDLSDLAKTLRDLYFPQQK